MQALRVAGAAACVLVLGPLGCGDDDSTPSFSDGGADASAGGSSGSGGKASGGKGGGIGSTGGSGGSTGGTAGSGGSSGGAGGSSGGAGGSSGGSGGADVDGGMGGADDDGGMGGSDDAGDGGPGPTVDGGDASPSCPPPEDEEDASLCLSFNPQVMDLGTTPDVDGQGYLIVQVFDNAEGDGTPSALLRVPPSPSDPNIGIDELPTIPIDGLPETVYIRSLFVDNPGWTPDLPGSGFLWGMWVGGVNLNSGIRAATPLRAVDLTAGEGTEYEQNMFAMRKFTTQVALAPVNTPTPNDDGQGPLEVGVFKNDDPTGFVFGGSAQPCVDVVAGAVPVVGFLYNTVPNPSEEVFWFSAQVDDFNVGGTPPRAGSLISSTTESKIPPGQQIEVAGDAYEIQAPTSI